MTHIALMERRITSMRKALGRMRSELDSVEKRRISIAAMSLVLLAVIGTVASYSFAQTAAVDTAFGLPFIVVDSSNRPILVVKADGSGRGVYVLSDEGKEVAALETAPDGHGGVVKAINADDPKSYAAIGASPAILGFSARRAGNRLVFAGQAESGVPVVQVFDGTIPTALAQIFFEGHSGQVEIRNKADIPIAVMKVGAESGGSLATFNDAGQAAFWAYGSVTGGDVCVWNPRFGQKCLGPEI